MNNRINNFQKQQVFGELMDVLQHRQWQFEHQYHRLFSILNQYLHQSAETENHEIIQELHMYNPKKLDAVIQINDDLAATCPDGKSMAFDLQEIHNDTMYIGLDQDVMTVITESTPCFGAWSHRSKVCKNCPIAKSCALKWLQKVQELSLQWDERSFPLKEL